MKTLYELLGVCPDASDEALKMAYHRLAKMHHPDLNPNDPEAPRRFREVTVAIEILCDAERRAAYNQRLVRELQRRLDRERQQRRSQTCMIAIGAVVGVAIAVVSVKASALLRPVSPIPVVTSGTASDVVQRSVMVSIATLDSLSPETSSDRTRTPANAVPPSQASTDGSEDSIRPEHPCQDSVSREASDLLTAGYDVERLEMALGCKLPEGRGVDERELSANEQAALIRHAQELLANGDAKGAHLLSQRACRGPRSRCGSWRGWDG